MQMWPAVKLMDCVVGIDVHAVAPDPGIPIHPYFGPIFLWNSPKFPSSNSVLLNGMPACSLGAMGYFAHMPQGKPTAPSMLNLAYWKRYLTNVPMAVTLLSMSVLANVTIAGIAALIPKPKSAEGFLREVTGINTSSNAATWKSIKSNLAIFTKWKTWVKLFIPPLPYPGAQGSIAVASPNVSLNGGPIAIAAPLVAASCSDIPFVPNATVIGFSNIMVGLDLNSAARGVVGGMMQGMVSGGVKQGAILATAIDTAFLKGVEKELEQERAKEKNQQGQKSSTGRGRARFRALVRNLTRP